MIRTKHGYGYGNIRIPRVRMDMHNFLNRISYILPKFKPNFFNILQHRRKFLEFGENLYSEMCLKIFENWQFFQNFGNRKEKTSEIVSRKIEILIDLF